MQTQAKTVKTHCPLHTPCVLVYHVLYQVYLASGQYTATSHSDVSICDDGGDYLMGTTDQVQVMLVQELGYHL